MATSNQKKRKWISEGPYQVAPGKQYDERRSEQRIGIQLNAGLCLLEASDRGRSGESSAVIHDVSQGGLRFTSKTPIRPGESALIRFAVPGGQARTRRVVIRWVCNTRSQGYEMGAESWNELPHETNPPEDITSTRPVYEVVAQFNDDVEASVSAAEAEEIHHQFSLTQYDAHGRMAEMDDASGREIRPSSTYNPADEISHPSTDGPEGTNGARMGVASQDYAPSKAKAASKSPLKQAQAEKPSPTPTFDESTGGPVIVTTHRTWWEYAAVVALMLACLSLGWFMGRWG